MPCQVRGSRSELDLGFQKILRYSASLNIACGNIIESEVGRRASVHKARIWKPALGRACCPMVAGRDFFAHRS